MKNLNDTGIGCRCCRYYVPTGRRGGTCHQLGAPVHGNWKACQLMIPAFTPTWDELSRAPQPLTRIDRQPVTAELQEFPVRISAAMLEDLHLQSIPR